MPKGAADIEIVFGSVLQEKRDAQIGCETQGGNRHDPAAVHRDGLQQSLESYECDAEGREQQDERSGNLGFPKQHLVSRETVIKELTDAGYKLLREHAFLPKQYFLEFTLSQ